MAVRAALARIAVPLTSACVAWVACRGWLPFGYARMGDHARERLGRSGRWMREQAELGRGLARFPALAVSLCGLDGRRALGHVAARLIGSVATEATIERWIVMARKLTVAQLRREVRRFRDGDLGCLPRIEAAGVEAMPNGGEVPSTGGPSSDRLVRLLAPSAVTVAFDETLALFRAVAGHDGTVTEFVEALVAEAHAGPAAPDVDCSPLRSAPDTEVREEAWARATGTWAALPEPDAPAELAASSLTLFEEVARRAGRGDPRQLDEQIRTLITLEDELQRQLGRLLCALADRGGWARLGFDGVRHYGEQRLGLSRTTVESRARLARTLGRWPQVRAAYEVGRIGLEAGLLVSRILGRSPSAAAAVECGRIEREWVERAGEATVKRLRDEARALARRRLDAPHAPPEPMTDREWHVSLRLAPGEQRRRVHELTHRAAVAARSSDVFLRLRLPEDLALDFTAAVESARRQLREEVGRVEWDETFQGAGARGSLLAARASFVRARRPPAWIGLLRLLEDFVDTWDDPLGMPWRAAGAVYARDGWRCAAPGCTSREHLEDHHIVYRSRGGSRKALSNRVCLCRFHHQRGEHGGLARCRGQAPMGVVWRLGLEACAEWFRNERRLARRDGVVAIGRAG